MPPFVCANMLAMATLVCFHAHPDDEAIATGGVMARAAAEGHRVVLVTATDGALGEVAEGFLPEGETLAARRQQEVEAAAEMLGVQRVASLGFRDSGMMGEPSNDDADCFWQCDVEDAAERLAQILGEESADVLTIYDENGGYGHPDHIQVHRVGVRAAELAGTRRVYESTVDRDAIRALVAATRASTVEEELAAMPEMPDVDAMQLGVASHLITNRADVRPFIEAKRKAMAAHASQISEESFFLAMPDDVFEGAFGTECFIARSDEARAAGDDLLAGL